MRQWARLLVAAMVSGLVAGPALAQREAPARPGSGAGAAAPAPAPVPSLFDLSLLPGSGFGTLSFSYRDFLLRNGHRAFAIVGETGSVYVSGHPSAEQAEREVLRLCQERNQGACRLYAVDNTIRFPGLPPMPPPAPVSAFGGQGWQTQPAPLLWRRGPGDSRTAAKGAVVWLHGYHGRETDQRGRAAPSWLQRFVIDGWDIWRLDREPAADGVPPRTRQQLEETIRRLRAMGYRQIIAAGHSYGAWHSFEALTRGQALDGVIAGSPARHGQMDDWAPRRTAARDDFLDLVRAAARSEASLALILPEGDPWDPEPGWRAETARRWFAHRPGTTAILIGPGDHMAVFAADTNTRFGACLLATMSERGRGLISC